MFIKKIFISLLFISEAMLGIDYSFSGDIANYSKFGFNHTNIDKSTGRYPTDSFSILYATPNLSIHTNNNFDMGIGFAFGGLIYDSTERDRDTSGNLVNPNGLGYKYFGYYLGKNGKEKASAKNTKDYFFSNLYIGYENTFFSLKVGRFLFRNTDWLTGNQEGAEMHIRPSLGKWNTDIWAVLTEKKSSLGGKWLKDFKFLNSNPIPTLATGIKIKNSHMSFTPYIQTQPTLYIMAALHFTYNTSFVIGDIPIESQTDFLPMFVHHTLTAQERFSVYDNGDRAVFGDINPKSPYLYGYEGRLVEKGGESLYLKQIFRISKSILKHHFGFQIYKNFGNPNEFVGGWGNPIGIDLNDSTIYDRGTANNAIFASDAFNNIFFYGLQYQNFNINMLNRYTISPRSNEESFSVNMDYLFPNKLSIGINITYFDDTTKKGYEVYQTYLKQDIKEDRSYISTYIKHSF
ncbi:outer membrane family protein [Helicobacter cappadocius]|uniref:Outer membrane family protein n=1 Tax=Helicobacter cappadocius TaxID=3063998 RepID=A0AA90T5N2_9HELI|nr:MULTISPECIES: outer membrane family protein [unclassified Helicobacter]MDO7253679.1 outer membrane family protein [Helicobacter sp. faydin-H75]MDP2539633.1 outer membrane family protein [Helicobacter sp. faydin-H76]